MNKFFLKNENGPPFRGVGGQKQREEHVFGGQKQREEHVLGAKTKIGT
jgi:hypothetical protein